MARLAKKRKSDDVASDVDDDAGTPPSSAESAASGRSKKQRTSRGFRARASQLLNGNHAPPTPNGLSNGDLRGLQPTADTLKHQPGSIVRLKLTDFVTYTSVEVFPGPSLNMVIGPNGTGKSTLVCAICLGLGWGPQHLGRAKDVGEFVKHGCHEAFIEIELRADGQRHRRNPVVRCSIKRETNKCAYLLNGKPASKKQVLATARGLAIQVDNLCSFLPQDRVVEFAAMTPVELLKSTQRAIGSQDMIDWHERLKEIRKAQRQLEQQEKIDREELANLEGRQRMQEADVERLRERETVKQNVEFLEAARPIAAYRDSKETLDQAKEDRNHAVQELNELEDAVEPTMRAVTAKQAYQDAVKTARDKRLKHRDDVEKQATKTSEKLEEFQKEIDSTVKSIEREKNQITTNQQDQRRLESIIRDLKKRIEGPSPEFDVAALNDQIRERERTVTAMEDKGREERAAMDQLKRSGFEKTAQVKAAEEEIASLDSQAGQQMVKLSKVSKDTWEALKWIRNNQDKFEKRVYGPPLVECSVKDPQYVDIIETLMQFGDLTSLTVQTQNDFEILHEALHEKLKLTRLSIRTVSDSLDRYQSPNFDEETMKKHGFDGWAIDYLQGPEPVLAMLCESVRIHVTGVALADTTAEQYAIIEGSRIDSWATSRSRYLIRRRAEYGAGATSTVVRATKKGQVWTDQPVDMSIKERLLNEIETWTREAGEMQKRFEVMMASFNRQKDQRNKIRDEKNKLEGEKKAKQQALSEYNGLPVRLQRQEDELAKVLNNVKETQRRVQGHEKKHDSFLLDKGQAVLEYAELVEKLRLAHAEVVEAEVALLEAQSDFEVLSERNKGVKERLEALRKEIEAFNKVVTDCGKVAKGLAKEVQSLKNAMTKDPALQQFVHNYNQEHPDLTGQSLQGDIDSEKAKLDLMHEGDGSIIVRFEERARKIAKLKERVAKLDHGLAETGDKIAELRAKWEPELERLVVLISDSFAFNMRQINCAGQVEVYRPANESEFDDWAIHIQVKFRENEPLSQLDAHRQSGGERAVSTVFYLMSLQALTRAPFRVVDEINQGMDPRNERLVHGRMVAIATGRDNWQPPEELVRPTVNGHANGDDAMEDEDDSRNLIHEDSDAAESADDARAPGRPQMRTGAATGVAGAAGSQYFLITPKLLHELKYEPGMRVLCIVSGERIERYAQADPKTQGFNFERAVAIRQGMTAKAH